METRASYFFVGLFVLVLVASAFGFAMWLARSSLQDDHVYYYVYFRGAVTGLQNGSQVLLRGVPIGTVTDIAIDSENIEEIQVTLAIRPNTPIKTDTVAQLQLQGITGLSVVQLSGGSMAAPSLQPREGKRRAVIPSRSSQIEQLFEQMPEISGQIVALTVRANDLLNDQNRAAITNIITNLDRTLATVAGSDLPGVMQDAQIMVRDASEAMLSFARTARALEGLTGELGRQTTRIGADAQGALREAQSGARAMAAMADEFQRLAAENRVTLRDFGESGLYELNQFLVELRALVSVLQRLASQMERDPARFLFGDQQRGVDAR